MVLLVRPPLTKKKSTIVISFLIQSLTMEEVLQSPKQIRLYFYETSHHNQ